MLCKDAVSKVWGDEALPCLEDRTQYCQELKQALNNSVGEECLNAYAAGIVITPYNAPETLFADFERHYNYDDCPLAWVRPDKAFICDGVGNPAVEEATIWFGLAKDSQDICTQVRFFCTGAFYLTSSYYPFLRVNHLQGCLGGSPETAIDEKLTSGETNWTLKEQCVFSFLKPLAGMSKVTTQHITFLIGADDYLSVSRNLTQAAEYVRNPELMPLLTTTTRTTTTSTLAAATTSSTPPSTILSTISPTTSTTATSTTAGRAASTTSTPTSSTKNAPTTALEVSTTSRTTTTRRTSPQDARLNQSLTEIDNLFADMKDEVQRDKAPEEPPKSNGIILLAVLAFVMIASIMLLVYLYTIMRRPTIHPSRKVVLPPSVRRRMKKGV